MRSAMRSVITGIILLAFAACLIVLANKEKKTDKEIYSDKYFWLLASEETRDFEDNIKNFARRNNIKIQIEYANTSQIIDKLNHSEKYDAVWLSDSIWLTLLDHPEQIKDSQSVAISPIVYGVRKEIASELGWIGRDVTINQILSAIQNKKVTFSTTSPDLADASSSLYLTYLSYFSKSVGKITESDLKEENVINSMKTLFSGINRVSGTNEYLDFLALTEATGIITYESSLIQINQKLSLEQEDPYYLIYPVDGVPLSNFPISYIDQNDSKKEETYYKIKSFLLSEEGRNSLNSTGRRAWFGGTSDAPDDKLFAPLWGIDPTTPFLTLPYPEPTIMNQAITSYQEIYKRPTHTVFVLDYSGSMIGAGNKTVLSVMEKLLQSEEATIPFSEHDKITIIPYNNRVLDAMTAKGNDTASILERISNIDVTGQTDFYEALAKAVAILKQEKEEFRCNIVFLTDGKGNDVNYADLQKLYQMLTKEIPIYAISYGQASEKQMKQLVELSRGKWFDGTTNLEEAFLLSRMYY